MHFRTALRLTSRIAAFLFILSSGPLAEARTITEALEGEWSGSGRLTLQNGKTERIRCHGTARSTTANTVDQFFNCASTGKNFSFSSSLHFSQGHVLGDWKGPNKSGTLSGTATSTRVRATLVSPSGRGSLNATISGCTQSLVVTGWSDELKSLSVQLKKAC